MLECKDYETMKMKPKSKNSPIDCPLPGCNSRQLKDLRAHLCRTHKAIPFEKRKALLSNLFPNNHMKGIRKEPLQLIIEELELEDEETMEQEHQHDGTTAQGHLQIDSDQQNAEQSLQVADLKGIAPTQNTNKITQNRKRKGDKLSGSVMKKVKKGKKNQDNNQEKDHLKGNLSKAGKATSDCANAKSDQTYDLLGSLLPSMMCLPTSSKETIAVKQNDSVMSSLQGKVTMDTIQKPKHKRTEHLSDDATGLYKQKEDEFFALLSALDLPDIEEICGVEERDSAVDDKHDSIAFHNMPDTDRRKNTEGDLSTNSSSVLSDCENHEDDTMLHSIPLTNKSQTELGNDKHVVVTTITDNAQVVEDPSIQGNGKPEITTYKGDSMPINSSTRETNSALLLQQSLEDMRNYISQHLHEIPCDIPRNSKLDGSGLDAPLVQSYLTDLACLFERTFDVNKFNGVCQIWVKMLEALSVLLELPHMEGTPHLLATLCESMSLLRQSVMRRVFAILGIHGRSNHQKNKLSMGCPHLFGKEFLDFVQGKHIGSKAVHKRAHWDKTLLASVVKKAAESWREVEVEKEDDECNGPQERQMQQKALQWICKGVPREYLEEASNWVGRAFHTEIKGKTFAKMNQVANSLARCLDVLGTMNSSRMTDTEKQLVASCLRYISTACALCEQCCNKSICFTVQ